MMKLYCKVFTASFTTLLSILPISLAHAQMISNNEDFKLYCSKEAYYFQAQSPDCDNYIQKIRQATRMPANQLLQRVEFPIGTQVKLSLAEDLSSKTSKEGDSVMYLVSEDVVSSGVVIIEKGASATGKVVKVNRSRLVGQGGLLNLTVDKVEAVDGTLIPLRSGTSKKGKSGLATAIGLTVLLTNPFFPSPLFLLIRGRNIRLKQGTIVEAYTDQGYFILSDRVNNSAKN